MHVFKCPVPHLQLTNECNHLTSYLLVISMSYFNLHKVASHFGIEMGHQKSAYLFVRLMII